jgi:hypothetical protein
MSELDCLLVGAAEIPKMMLAAARTVVDEIRIFD